MKIQSIDGNAFSRCKLLKDQTITVKQRYLHICMRETKEQKKNIFWVSFKQYMSSNNMSNILGVIKQLPFFTTLNFLIKKKNIFWVCFKQYVF